MIPSSFIFRMYLVGGKFVFDSKNDGFEKVFALPSRAIADTLSLSVLQKRNCNYYNAYSGPMIFHCQSLIFITL